MVFSKPGKASDKSFDLSGHLIAITMDIYLRKLIAGGENQQLDFKYCVSDSRKIARTLSAFSNSDGGKILIGVRDNGRIAGIKTDEEIYMVDTAAQLFCRPEITYTIKDHIRQRMKPGDGDHTSGTMIKTSLQTEYCSRSGEKRERDPVYW
jgi:hypothetical protein